MMHDKRTRDWIKKVLAIVQEKAANAEGASEIVKALTSMECDDSGVMLTHVLDWERCGLVTYDDRQVMCRALVIVDGTAEVDTWRDDAPDTLKLRKR